MNWCLLAVREAKSEVQAYVERVCLLTNTFKLVNCSFLRLKHKEMSKQFILLDQFKEILPEGVATYFNEQQL